jgi:hypothetical protein
MEWQVLTPLNTKQLSLECPLSVCMDVHLVSIWTVARILFIFGIQEFVHHRSVPSKYEHSNSKNRGPSDGPQNTKWLIKFQLQRPYSWTKTAYAIMWGK